MFQPGQILKVKVENNPGEYGFGRATIVDRVGKNILVQIKTSRDSNKQLSKGTKLWFVNDSPRLTFNGMWGTNVVGSQIVKGRTCLVCSSPKLEPVSQKRKLSRVSVNMPVTISLMIEGKEKLQFRTVDLCKSGSAVETSRIEPDSLDVGKEIGTVLHTDMGDVNLTARIIRVEQNWLQNKTTIALEFIALSKESSDILDQLLVKLGGNPRDSELESMVRHASTHQGMEAWRQQVQPDEQETSENEGTKESEEKEDETNPFFKNS